MVDLNGNMGLMEETVNQNGQLTLDFAADMEMRIKNWELENPVTWRDRAVSLQLIVMVNEQIEQDCRIWKNEGIDVSDHLISITCGKEVWKEKWNLRKQTG